MNLAINALVSSVESSSTCTVSWPVFHRSFETANRQDSTTLTSLYTGICTRMSDVIRWFGLENCPFFVSNCHNKCVLCVPNKNRPNRASPCKKDINNSMATPYLQICILPIDRNKGTMQLAPTIGRYTCGLLGSCWHVLR